MRPPEVDAVPGDRVRRPGAPDYAMLAELDQARADRDDVRWNALLDAERSY